MICFCKSKETLSRLLPDEYPNKIYNLNDKPDILDTDLVLWVDEVILQPDSVNKLKTDLRTHLDAGLISGVGDAAYVVDDIYNPTEGKIIEKEGVVPVDIASKDLFVCMGRVFKELELNEKLFGLSLRKLGYQNYIDTSVLIEKENKNAKDNNVKGASCQRKI